jgi:hypothetical protein
MEIERLPREIEPRAFDLGAVLVGDVSEEQEQGGARVGGQQGHTHDSRRKWILSENVRGLRGGLYALPVDWTCPNATRSLYTMLEAAEPSPYLTN